MSSQLVLIYTIDAIWPFSDDASDVNFENSTGRYWMQSGHLYIFPALASSNIDDLREYVTPTLQAWELENELVGDYGNLKFNYLTYSLDIDFFEYCPIVKREEMPERDGRVLVIELNNHPTPPKIRVNTTMTAAWNRVRAAHVGVGESIQSATYFLITAVESLYGGRKKASVALKIEHSLIRRAAELASTRGDMNTARKASILAPLTNVDKAFLYAFCKGVIYQMGLVEAGAEIDMLTYKVPSEKAV